MRVLGQRHDIEIVARDFDSDLPFPSCPSVSPAGCPVGCACCISHGAPTGSRAAGSTSCIRTNGWAGEIQVMHVTPVRYNRLTRAKPLKRLTAWLSPGCDLPAAREIARASGARAPRGGRVRADHGPAAPQLRSGLAVDIIAPGVKLPSAADAAQRQAVRDRLGWDADTIGCLLVARNPLRKGCRRCWTLGAAARALPAAGGRGRRSHARTRARRRRHRAPGRPDRTHPEVAQYFSAADIYAHPTLNDSYGMAPLEAMSHGLPVVVSSPAYCGFAQYLSAGRTR